MKISQIQSYQPVKLKQNMVTKKQNNTTPTFKGGISTTQSFPRIFRPFFKVGVLMLTVLGMNSCIRSECDKNAQKYLQSELLAHATDYESEEGSNFSSQEMEYYYDALAFYDRIKNEKVSGYQLKILSYWTGYYTNLKTEEGMKLSAKEKEQIKFAVDNKIGPAERLHCDPEPSHNNNHIMQQEFQRQYMHNLLFNNK